MYFIINHIFILIIFHFLLIVKCTWNDTVSFTVHFINKFIIIIINYTKIIYGDVVTSGVKVMIYWGSNEQTLGCSICHLVIACTNTHPPYSGYYICHLANNTCQNNILQHATHVVSSSTTTSYGNNFCHHVVIEDVTSSSVVIASTNNNIWQQHLQGQ